MQLNRNESQYGKTGVDTDKTVVKEIFESGGKKKMFPRAWVTIKPDLWEPDTHVMAMHSDGVGSLTVTRLIAYLETGDPSYLKGDIINAFEMNMDIAASGFVKRIVESDVININQNYLTEDGKATILRVKKETLDEVVALYDEFAFSVVNGKIEPMDGETADLVDQTSSCIMDLSFFSRMLKEDVVAGEVKIGDIILGVSSGGRAIWETEENYGPMSNGATHKRSGLLHPMYGEKYPFLVSPHNPLHGPFKIMDYVAEVGTTIGKAMTSPCRHIGIIIKLVIDELKTRKRFHDLSGIAVVSGGGLKKVINLGAGIRYELHLMDEIILPLFRLIKHTTSESWYNMFKSYNNGICLQFVGSGVLEDVVRTVCAQIGINWYRLGQCSPTRHPQGKNEVLIYDPWGNQPYYYDK